ncbi:TPA: trypsin-like serine protease [Vibrio parahaemolyticus]|uniref:serine protease n=1 Tax=Vibrio parahaemolyticus TaxID=670 RepID=UPI00064B4F56|nr:serine protease [Vibrio parahaemolyticus]EGR1981850.1 serine protease [Vibrio parahaemolyticus]EII3439606.1 serine protease [Vibrio parahaemolyticus]ELA7842176.1 serine protease [Vibrio parahaemolyticus]OXD30924.1 serine protease [Vibrio parahaemolyticus]HAS6806191.1 trypsin-like serine protease [Vibrio parahaemolyticus]
MKKTLVAFLIGLTLPATTIADTLKPVQNDVSTRIIGGEPANTSDWKFIASLVRKGQPTSIGHFCGGSFLGGKYVLTAAHCVEGLNADDIDIVLGLYDQNNESQAQRIAIKNIYSHDEYNNITTNNDIALIELERNIDSATIDLATPELLDSVRVGDKLHVAGWGNTSTTDRIYPTVLQQVDLEYVDRATCQNLPGNYSNVSDDGICAGYYWGGKDSCQGDSGGPLIVDDNGINKLLGVVSWGDGCAQPNAYGVYANVAHFQHNGWIDSHRNTISFTKYRDLRFVERKAQQETFTIRNDDTIPLNIYESTISYGSTIEKSTCTGTLKPSQSCQITVGYQPSYSGSETTIELFTDHPKLSRLTTTFEYSGVDKASRSVRNAIPLADANVYTGQNAWTAENGELQSADMGMSTGASILHLTDLPKGKLSMDFKVLSDGFDYFVVFVNGQEYDYTRQLLDYKELSIDLYRKSNTVTFAYLKNYEFNGGYNAQAYIRNIKMSVSSDNTSKSSITKTSSSGGSFSISLLMLLAAGSFLRRQKG